MKKENEIKDRIIELAATKKEGAAGAEIKGWIRALQWVME